jgi:hypothetical protein
MGRRWPPTVAICLRLMIALDLSAEEATKFLKMRRGRASATASLTNSPFVSSCIAIQTG